MMGFDTEANTEEKHTLGALGIRVIRHTFNKKITKQKTPHYFRKIGIKDRTENFGRE